MRRPDVQYTFAEVRVKLEEKRVGARREGKRAFGRSVAARAVGVSIPLWRASGELSAYVHVLVA